MIPKMPGKDSTDYVPVPLNFTHASLYDFTNLNFEDGCAYFINRTGTELTGKYARSRSGSESGGCVTRGRTRNVSFNETLPPENANPNPKEEEEDAASVQSSSDFDADCEDDVDMNDVDRLVLRIREQLSMDPSYSSRSSFWTTASATGMTTDEDSNQSSCSTGAGAGRRAVVRPASWKRKNYTHRSLATIQRHKICQQTHRWWTSTSTSMSKSLHDLSSADRSQDEAYQVLQELIESGGLIKEAVRRIKKKAMHLSAATATSIKNPNPNLDPNACMAMDENFPFSV